MRGGADGGRTRGDERLLHPNAFGHARPRSDAPVYPNAPSRYCPPHARPRSDADPCAYPNACAHGGLCPYTDACAHAHPHPHPETSVN